MKTLTFSALLGFTLVLASQAQPASSRPPDSGRAAFTGTMPPGDGGPRNITSDGKTFFAVSEHNNGEQSLPATMVWNSFPTSPSQQPDWKWSEWVKGSFTPDGKLVVGGMQSVYLWNRTPRNAETDADVVLRPAMYRNGDGPDAVVANGRLYVGTYNGNHILGWNALPTRDDQPADALLGATDVLVDKAAEELYPTWQKHLEQWKVTGGDHAYHYLGSAIWFTRIGQAMGGAMKDLLAAK